MHRIVARMVVVGVIATGVSAGGATVGVGDLLDRYGAKEDPIYVSITWDGARYFQLGTVCQG